MDLPTLFKSVKLVAFDIDQTLADVDNILSQADDVVYEYIKKNYPTIELDKPDFVTKRISEYSNNNKNTYVSVGRLREMFYEELVVESGLSTDVGRELSRIWQQQRNQYKLYDIVKDLLYYLHSNGLIIGAITDGTANFTNHPEVNCIMQFFVSPNVCGCSKHDGSSYRYVNKQFSNIPISECLMVGDNALSDIIASKKEGWNTIFVDCHGKGSIAEANAIVKNIREIYDAIV